ncbi:ABC transporter substrate-binding protein [Glaciibacter sp. 2TAF33]|uniref:ABC transporter substrate-binding protein n=1 Tax=Glaciibacter sp. 2TAF33 TaxID=3233015 RepID=UPI003F93A007
MKLSKPLAVLMGLGLIGATLTGCSPQKAAESPTASKVDEDITLTVLSPLVVEKTESVVEKGYADAYMKAHPHVKIEFIGVPMNDAYAKISTLATGGQMPDIFINSPEFDSKADQLGIVANMDKLLGKEYLAGFEAAPLKQAKLDGKTQFAPYFTIPTGLLYRSDLFEAAGLKAPTTWDEFEAAAKKLTVDTDGDGQTDRWGFAMVGTNDGSGGSRFIPIMRTFGAQELVADGSSWKTQFGTADAAKAFKLYGDLVNKDGAVPPGPLQTGYAQANALLATDKAAMMVTGPHTIGAILAQNPDLEGKLAGAPLPHAPGKKSVSVLGMLGWSISADSKHKAAAADYIKFMLNKKNQLAWNAATGRFPTRTDAISDPQVNRPELQGFIKAQDNAFQLPAVPFYADLQVIAGNSYQQVILNKMSPEEAAKSAAGQTETTISNNG